MGRRCWEGLTELEAAFPRTLGLRLCGLRALLARLHGVKTPDGVEGGVGEWSQGTLPSATNFGHWLLLPLPLPWSWDLRTLEQIPSSPRDLRAHRGRRKGLCFGGLSLRKVSSPSSDWETCPHWHSAVLAVMWESVKPCERPRRDACGSDLPSTGARPPGVPRMGLEVSPHPRGLP